MRIKTACLFVVSLLVASNAMAKICKSIGPDGSVTFTDRPVASCESAAPAEQQTGPVPAPATATVVSPRQSTIKKAEAKPPADAPDATRARSVEKAVIGVMGMEDLVQRSHDFCVGVLPTSMRRYGAAADGWRMRNNGATARMRVALSQSFTNEQQRLIAEGVKQRNQQQLAAVTSAPKASQVQWCDQTSNEIEARALDIHEDVAAQLSVL